MQTKSQLYGDLLPLVNSEAVRLLDNDRLKTLLRHSSGYADLGGDAAYETGTQARLEQLEMKARQEAEDERLVLMLMLAA